MKKSELQQIIKEEINKFRLKPGDPGYTDNGIANNYASDLTNRLFYQKNSSPLQCVTNWGNELEKDPLIAGRLTKSQIEDLKKEAIALVGITKGTSRYKQVLKDKILKVLKGEKIR
jgi:hypothetical protein